MKNKTTHNKIKKLFDEYDDGIYTIKYLSEIYDNVPKEFQNVKIAIVELHEIIGDSKLKKKVIKWLGGN